ncbi:26S proteasome regulatory complex non-ATPase subcomplex Rpn1 subunit [Mycena leptocephala]|nr:26S proteasome regulatory complex non-ATPase subcomplex Rpn1 subunit [Mycena leptocephala]
MRSLPDSTELAIQVTSEDPKRRTRTRRTGCQSEMSLRRSQNKNVDVSMTSVPNHLNSYGPLYPDLQVLYETWPDSEDKSLFCRHSLCPRHDYSDTQPRGTLRYRLLSASLRPAGSPLADPGTWGHEYVRHLAAELGDEYTLREQEVDAPTPTPAPEAGKEEAPAKVEVTGTVEDLRALAKECAVFLIGHNAEPDAVDLLEELEIVDEVAQLVDDNTYNRVCQYMIRCHHKFPEALALVIRLGDPDLIREDFNGAGNPLMKRQLAFLLARAQTPIEWLRTPSENPDKEIDIEDEFPKDLRECLSNTRMSGHFRDFGKELGVTDPKSLEDVYKTHLENTRPTTLANVDSARGNLAGTFVNAFVNAGFGNDKLMVYKNKEHGMMSATASLGLSLLWDTDLGLSHVDKYTYSSEEYINAGALLATGILNSGVRTEADVAKGLISKYVDNKSVPLKTSAIMGLALAYARSHREDLLQLLIPHISDDATMEIVSLATLALGFIFVGSENGEITSMILQTLMEKAERGDIGLDEKWARFMASGLGLLYLGLQDASDTTIETLKAIEHPISKTAQIVVEVCTFAGTGNVLKVQAMLRHCDEHINMKEKEADKDEKKEEKKDEPAEGAAKEEAKPEGKPDDTFQAFAVIAVALIAMGEDVGAEMSLRQFHHLMHYGEPVIRKSVPLAIGLVSISNPQLPILDTLSKYSHDNDLAMLRQLAGYYYKEPDCLFMVRVAQGLVHMGKGMIGLNPFFADRSIMSRPAMVGLLATLTAFTDAKHFILDKYHWMMYFLVTAMYPAS